MEASLTPRQIAKNLLSGELPPRPLVLPIVFSLGAKVENVPVSAFLNNPTKIVSAARQLRNLLQADGIACYFDSYLEVEALGANLRRGSPDEPPVVEWKCGAKVGELPEGMRSPEEAAHGGRVPVAAEVIRRMNALANRDFLLMASVSGPLALAGRLTKTEKNEGAGVEDFSAAAWELASSVVTQVATTFLEAGADSIFIHDQIPCGLTTTSCEEWANLLAPVVNVTRFYEALPVLQLGEGPAALKNWEIILQQPWECALCAPDSIVSSQVLGGASATQAVARGIALSRESCLTDNGRAADRFSDLREAMTKSKPAILTTAGDVPFATDMKHLKKLFEEIPRGW